MLDNEMNKVFYIEFHKEVMLGRNMNRAFSFSHVVNGCYPFSLLSLHLVSYSGRCSMNRPSSGTQWQA